MRLKSEFESLRKRGRFSEPISFAAELHIISTLRLKALRVMSEFHLLRECARQGAWAPGRAEKFHKYWIFMYQFQKFGAHGNPSAEKISAGNAWPETRPGSFCSSFNALSGLAGPVSNEWLNFEKSSREHAPGHQFSSANLQQNCLCRRITLRAKGSTNHM